MELNNTNNILIFWECSIFMSSSFLNLLEFIPVNENLYSISISELMFHTYLGVHVSIILEQPHSVVESALIHCYTPPLGSPMRQTTLHH